MEAVNTWMLEQYVRVVSAVSATFKREDGQGFGEYALIFALVVVVAAATLSPLGTKIKDEFTTVTGLFGG